MRRMLVLTALSLSLLSLRVPADQVTLKNGDRLSGTLVKSDEDAKTVLIKTDLAGDVTIKWDAVTAIMSSQPLRIILSDGRAIVGSGTTTDAIHGGVRDDFSLTAKLYAFGFTDFDEDALQHLDLRNVLGGGLGSHIVNTKQTQFDVFGGASFNQEYFASYTTANPAPPP